MNEVIKYGLGFLAGVAAFLTGMLDQGKVFIESLF